MNFASLYCQIRNIFYKRNKFTYTRSWNFKTFHYYSFFEEKYTYIDVKTNISEYVAKVYENMIQLIRAFVVKNTVYNMSRVDKSQQVSTRAEGKCCNHMSQDLSMFCSLRIVYLFFIIVYLKLYSKIYYFLSDKLQFIFQKLRTKYFLSKNYVTWFYLIIKWNFIFFNTMQ